MTDELQYSLNFHVPTDVTDVSVVHFPEITNNIHLLSSTRCLWSATPWTPANCLFLAASKDFARSNSWRFSVAVTRWSRSTQLLYIEPG